MCWCKRRVTKVYKPLCQSVSWRRTTNVDGSELGRNVSKVCQVLIKTGTNFPHYCEFSGITVTVFLLFRCNQITPEYIVTALWWMKDKMSSLFFFLVLQQDVEKFSDIEKLYLYLKLPSGPSSNTEKRWGNSFCTTKGLSVNDAQRQKKSALMCVDSSVVY